MSVSTTLLDATSVFDLIADIPGHLLRIKRTMIGISHVLEDAAAATPAPCHLFVGFQRLSLFARQWQRYQQFSPRWAHCFVFGLPDADVPPLPRVTVVPIDPCSPLANEWFVVADGPSFSSALLSADTSGFAIADPSRRFLGLLTADPLVVRAASTRLLAALDRPALDHTVNPYHVIQAYERISSQILALHEEQLLTSNAR